MNERTRSFWGWGYSDKFPDDDARAGFCTMAHGLLGFDGLEARPAPSLDALTLPGSALEIPGALTDLCTTSFEARASRTYGKSYKDLVRGFRGDFSPAPDVVAQPRTEDDVERVLEWAGRERLVVVPFGGGTSVVGGVECGRPPDFNGVVCLDVRGLDRVVELDDVSHAARIQAGATGPVLEAQLKERGFTLRHYPQSYEFSTLGGWIATRAGGHFATGQTRIDDFVESVRMLTPSGWYESRRLPGSGAGPSPDASLALGSEGILGVITDAWVRVRRPPRFRARASVFFDQRDRAVEAVRHLSQSGLQPANCRLLDPMEAKLNSVTSEDVSVLVLAFESADHPLEPWLERALAIAVDAGGRVQGEARYEDAGPEGTTGAESGAGERWKNAFFEAPYLQNIMVSIGVIADTFETACTWDQFPALDAAIREGVHAAMKRVAGTGHLSCRFTHVYPDGPAPYYTFLAPAKVGGELEQWAEIKAAAGEAMVANGATITHHHAVGRTHRPWYDRQRPELYAKSLSALKKTLDPDGILNPGVLID